MEKILTAKEFIENYIKENNDSNLDVEDALIEFAKLHVEATLKAVSEKKTSGFLQTSIFSEYQVEEILNSYPLENIK